ncbi:MAG TPA: hypothetical protein H9828_00455 [Candidatus Alistipes intestinigallinarum]|uniref:Thioredoxin domain-containing protein n=1 Tax=Candidatus Alistipes intestinigallinarum TaxID=2838440 RepID=A0A9D1YXV2_9BACT|nr:hypothetical protein [Candidatus Alistipes intestinigallinarum]
MKKALLILLSVWILSPSEAEAQNIILGEKVPELKAAGWIDNRHPAPAPITYVEFFHSSNPACINSLKRLRALATKPKSDLRVIVVTREDTARIASMLRPYLSERVTATIHADRGFSDFGVTYVPFGVLIDARNRALWMGNSLQFNEKVIEQSK